MRKVKVGEGEVCKGKRGAFRAGGDNVSALAAVMGKSRIEDEGAVPVKVP
jgi:hypothetical protein